jgi:hypothetical protein
VFVNVILAKRALVRSYEICNARYYTDRIPYPHTHGEGSSDDPTNRDICPNGDNPFDVADCIVGITKYMDYETVITDHPGGTPAGLSQTCQQASRLQALACHGLVEPSQANPSHAARFQLQAKLRSEACL